MKAPNAHDTLATCDSRFALIFILRSMQFIAEKRNNLSGFLVNASFLCRSRRLISQFTPSWSNVPNVGLVIGTAVERLPIAEISPRI